MTAPMRRYTPCLLDPRAEKHRQWMRNNPAKDLASGTMRLALHLSSEEHAALERLNPDTLGHDDTKLHDLYWRDFIENPASAPFRVRAKV